MNLQKLLTRNDGKQVKQKEKLTARGKVQYKPLLVQFGHIILNCKILQSQNHRNNRHVSETHYQCC